MALIVALAVVFGVGLGMAAGAVLLAMADRARSEPETAEASIGPEQLPLIADPYVDQRAQGL